MNDLVAQAEAFARRCHDGQFRKGAAREPYIIHIEEVAALVTAWGGSPETIAAAWLHDTVEDCPPTSFQDIADNFGPKVAGMVAELTDDKSLPKPERKRLQLANAPHKSAGAALVKLADKTSNVGALASSPPAAWPLERRLVYIDWATEVVGAMPGLPPECVAEFKRRCVAARDVAIKDFA